MCIYQRGDMKYFDELSGVPALIQWKHQSDDPDILQ